MKNGDGDGQEGVTSPLCTKLALGGREGGAEGSQRSEVVFSGGFQYGPQQLLMRRFSPSSPELSLDFPASGLNRVFISQLSLE